MPEHQFGGFVAAVAPPMTIGNVVLQDGDVVKGVLCEAAATSGSTDMCHSAGWRRYLQSLV